MEHPNSAFFRYASDIVCSNQFSRLEMRNTWSFMQACLVLGFGLLLGRANVSIVHLCRELQAGNRLVQMRL